MDTPHPLAAELERTAEQLGISPSTVGMRAGQGGQFYARLVAGKRVWPETESSVRDALAQMVSSATAAPNVDAAT